MIDKLASEGIRYTNALVTNSLPAASNAAMMTGKYCSSPGNTVCRRNPDVDYYNDNGWTFVRELKEKLGYTTALIGDWHLGDKIGGFDYSAIIDQADNSVEGASYYSPTFKINGVKDEKPNKTHSTEGITGYA